ncbi:hypothetical protein A7E75_03785 [Syntrophotalea acetylenica]|uniref:Uncharacterized protein n=1 Tax=Syntrophotalea acetylenica TaxID=29542 RepID=A0A1L3GE58_SYNAC|nr:hypothetical protein A7E75_03785 [Syntrophotalea acetylenica]APG44833.1 hypothetical protein A6070_12410 [Syntrophotalea acetylenica]
MTKTLQNSGYAVEMFAADIDTSKERIEFIGDAFLFVERSKHKGSDATSFGSEPWHVQSVTNGSDIFEKLRVFQPIEKIPAIEPL